MPKGYDSERHLTIYLERWQKKFLTEQAKENNRSISQQVVWFLKDIFKEARGEELSHKRTGGRNSRISEDSVEKNEGRLKNRRSKRNT